MGAQGAGRRRWRGGLWAGLVMVMTGVMAKAAEVVAVLPVHDRLLMVHFDEGYVIHHRAGQPRSAETVVISPLDVDAAQRPETWTLRSPDDPAYAEPRHPDRVGRKSKGTNFAWFVDRWVDNRAVNDRPDHTKDHWLYLELPSPLQRGKTYTLTTGELNTKGPNTFTFTFDEALLRSEAVKVNLLGYAPRAPRKFGYVFHWAGDLGGIDFKPYSGNRFRVLDTASGAVAAEGRLTFRAPAATRETLHVSDSPPAGSFLNADVYEADFSSLTTPGEYVLVVDGIGSSFPFRVGDDVYRPAYRATARALYHNRSGIELKRPFTEFTRPAPHHPRLTPGFADKLIYTTLRWADYGSESGTKEAILATKKGVLEDSWGWYQDAGDWDSYYTHWNVPRHLLLAYDIAPQNFADGENNIPESGNGIPDLLDEATWLARFAYRQRHELMRKGWGTGGLGMRVAGDAFGTDEGTLPDGTKVGRPSWQDTDRFYAVSGEDPWSTFGYAGVAAQLAYFLRQLGKDDPEGVDWAAEAAAAYAWAVQNTRDGDEAKFNLRSWRAYAAAALFRLTGDRAYERQLDADTADITPTTYLWWENIYAPYLHALTTAAGPRGDVLPEPGLHERLKSAVLFNADDAVAVAERRALRWAGKWDMPMLVGQQTTPWAMELGVGYALVRKTDPPRAQRYLATLYTTADHFLGVNSLNIVWMTGVGPRHVEEMFHMDAWYNGPDGGSKGYHEGLIPYSPWRKEREFGQGPWDVAWAHKTVYPHIDQWPGNERWFPNRCTPLGLEFTVHQNIGPAAAFYGLLAAPGLGAEGDGR